MAESVLVIACGALAREIHALKQLNGWDHLKLTCLPAELHFTPALIADRLRERIQRYKGQYQQIFVAYADCGTYGAIDKVLKEEGIERLPGEHCYATFAGQELFTRMQDQEIGTFYLTDFLVRHFDRFVVKSLKLDQHPELLPMFFGNYTRALYLAQTKDAKLLKAAKRAADYLHLRFEQISTAYGELETELAVRIAS